MPDSGGLDVDIKVSETRDEAGSEPDGQIFNSIFNEQIEVAQNKLDGVKDGSIEGMESDEAQSNIANDPLKEFWSNRDRSAARFIPDMDKVDNSWKPFYDEIVKSEGYGLIQDYQRNFEGLYNRVNVLTPEGERESLWNNVVSFMKGEEGAEAKLAGNPEILEHAQEMKDIVRNPEFHATREIAQAVTPLIQYSIQGREIMAEEAVKGQLTAPGMELIFEANQLKRFIESMSIRKAPKVLINDSRTQV